MLQVKEPTCGAAQVAQMVKSPHATAKTWSDQIRSDQLLSRVRLLRPHGLWPARLLCPWDSPGKNTGVGCHFLLQGIFLTQESNPGLLHCRQMLYCLSHQGSPNTGKPAYSMKWQKD